MKTILIVGATSAIAEQCARLYAAEHATLLLVARNPEKLESVASDLRVRGAKDVKTFVHEASDHEAVPGLMRTLVEKAKGIDASLIAHGSLGEQALGQTESAEMVKELNVNFLSAAVWAGEIANALEAQSRGTLAVISSVAGLRGRQSNYIYGAAKGGLNIFLQGLRNRMTAHGVNVLTVLPGFVDTPMTADVPKNKLFASAESVGKDIHKAMENGKPDVLYTPGIWKGIMLIIRVIPEFLFKKLSL